VVSVPTLSDCTPSLKKIPGGLWLRILDEDAVGATGAAEGDELIRVRRPSGRAVREVVLEGEP
jgi:hypothetical protein